MKTALVCGAGGFIGSHLVKRLKSEGYEVSGIDLRYPEFGPTAADEFVIGDLRNQEVCKEIMDRSYTEVYQLAADTGGAGYILGEGNNADIMYNSAMVNLNIVDLAYRAGVQKIFFSSAASIYPVHNQQDQGSPDCSEESAYPALPDSEYGWEKLFSERLYMSYARNKGFEVSIARLHNIFGPEGKWTGGKENAPAAFCRKIATTNDGGTIKMWGDGKQTRSFLYIDECLNGIRNLVESDFMGPVNIGSEEIVSINQLCEMIADIAGKRIHIEHIDGPVGVAGRNSDNKLIDARLGWKPSRPLRDGLEITYKWISEQIEQSMEKDLWSQMNKPKKSIVNYQ